MSDEKLDRIESRVNQIFDMFGKMIGVVTDLRTDVGQIKADVSELKSDVSELKSDVKRLDGKTDDIARTVLTIQKDLDGFKEETRQNFTDVKSEMRFMNRKSTVLANDMVDVRARLFDVENKVDELERKDAA